MWILFCMLCCSVILCGQTPVTLMAMPNPSLFGQSVTLTASVSPDATGKVTFYDGTTVLGTATLAGGQAVLSTLALGFGARSLRARYKGDATHPAGYSSPLSHTVASVGAYGFSNPVDYP